MRGCQGDNCASLRWRAELAELAELAEHTLAWDGPGTLELDGRALPDVLTGVQLFEAAAAGDGHLRLRLALSPGSAGQGGWRELLRRHARAPESGEPSWTTPGFDLRPELAEPCCRLLSAKRVELLLPPGSWEQKLSDELRAGTPRTPRSPR